MIPRIRSYRTYERILQVLWNVGARYADLVERLVPEASKRTKQGQTRSVRGRRAQLIKKLVSYWCEWCECAFQRKDVPNTFPHDPSCPVCGKQLVEFELDNIAPEWNMDIAQDAEDNWVPKDDLEL